MRLAYASLLLLAVPACETSGQRAGTGQCPTGEVCSAKTPDGLHFRGPDYADDWIADPSVKRTAVGGTQTISVINAQDEQLLAFPYTATLDSANLTADAPQGPMLTLHGQGSGAALLRIKDAADGTLFDRVSVEAAPIAHADIVAFHQEALLPTDPSPAILVGHEVQLEARLWADATHRLVDQSLQIGTTGQPTQARTWDTVAVTPQQTGSFGVSLTAAGQQLAVGSVAVVDGIDAVVPGWTSFDATTPPLAKQSLTACVEARRNGVPVVGLTYQLSATGADSQAQFAAGNCLSFTRNTAGTVTIHGVAGGLSADLVVTVGASNARRILDDEAPLPDVTFGERASAMLE